MLNFFKQYGAKQQLNPEVELFPKLISTELDKFNWFAVHMCRISEGGETKRDDFALFLDKEK